MFLITIIGPFFYIAFSNWMVSFLLFKQKAPLQRALMTTGVSTLLVSIFLAFNLQSSMPADLEVSFLNLLGMVIFRLILPAGLCFAIYYFMLKRRWVDEPDAEVFD